MPVTELEPSIPAAKSHSNDWETPRRKVSYKKNRTELAKIEILHEAEQRKNVTANLYESRDTTNRNRSARYN